MRWPLRYQILTPFAALTLLAILAVTLLNAYLAARWSQRHIEQQLRDIARTLMHSDFPLGDAVLSQMSGLSGAEFLLTDKAGKVVATSGPLAQELDTSSAVSQWEDLRLGLPIEIGSKRYFYMVLNLNRRVGRSESGLLHILYPEDVWRLARRQAVYPSLIVGGVALFAVVLVAFIVAGRLSKPISALRIEVSRLTTADFRSIPLPSRNDEIRDLVASINSLAAQLEGMRGAIQRGERLALLGQLSGGMAHSLRNEVTGARMALQLHQKHCPGTDGESLAVALRQLSLMEEHLKRLLAAGQPQTAVKVNCDIVAIVADVTELVSPSCRHRKIDISSEFKIASTVVIDGDPDQLRHLLLNLVLNAVEAAGPHGWIRIRLHQPESCKIAVRVLDSGAGPPLDTADRLFEVFTTSKPEGVGLGLAVAKQIAESHDGTLGHGKENGMTYFELQLPYRVSGSRDGVCCADATNGMKVVER